MSEVARPPLTGMHGIAYRAGKDIFRIFGFDEVTDERMKAVQDVLVRMLQEEMQHIGNKTGWVQAYHREQKLKGKKR